MGVEVSAPVRAFLPSISTGETLDLKRALALAVARIDALEARVAEVVGVTALPLPLPLPPVTKSVTALKLGAAEKQRAYRERQKAKK